jgi:hypothetical protein
LLAVAQGRVEYNDTILFHNFAYKEQNPTAGLAMGFENSWNEKLNLDRRAAWKQRA